MEWIALGVFLIIIGMLFIAIGILSSVGAKTHVEAGTVVFVGPIPVVFATSERAAVISILLALATIIAVILWLRI